MYAITWQSLREHCLKNMQKIFSSLLSFVCDFDLPFLILSISHLISVSYCGDYSHNLLSSFWKHLSKAARIPVFFCNLSITPSCCIFRLYDILCLVILLKNQKWLYRLTQTREPDVIPTKLKVQLLWEFLELKL